MLIYDVVFNKEWAFYAKNELFTFLRKKRFFTYYKNGKIVFCVKKNWPIKRINPSKIKLIKN